VAEKASPGREFSPGSPPDTGRHKTLRFFINLIKMTGTALEMCFIINKTKLEGREMSVYVRGGAIFFTSVFCVPLKNALKNNYDRPRQIGSGLGIRKTGVTTTNGRSW
jgi:hypothetical protein